MSDPLVVVLVLVLVLALWTGWTEWTEWTVALLSFRLLEAKLWPP